MHGIIFYPEEVHNPLFLAHTFHGLNDMFKQNACVPAGRYHAIPNRKYISQTGRQKGLRAV